MAAGEVVTRQPGEPRADASENALDPKTLLRALASGKYRTTIQWAIVGGLVGLILAFALPRPYVATATILPESATRTTGLSGLSGLGGVLGLSSEALLGRESIKFYADLLRSRELLERVATTQYPIPEGGSADLVQLWGGWSSDTAKRLIKARARLMDRTAVSADPSTGLIKFAARASSPRLATQIMQAYVDALQDFIQKRRNSRARAEREFLGKRLAESSAQLDSAEGALERFYVSNRRVEGSPRLLFEETKLRRRVDLVQALYTSVAHSYDDARLSEVRDTPIITVIDRPEGSEERVSSKASLLLVLGMVVGAAGSLALHRSRRANAAGA